MKLYLKENWPLYLLVSGVVFVIVREVIDGSNRQEPVIGKEPSHDYWVAPSLYLDNTLEGEARSQVIYGEDIIANTSRYFGPHGTVLQITNGMNCQNCHLQAGKQAWGNNYGAVFSTYPKFRDRSGTVETIPKRVNDCIERSLNGKALDTNSNEMKAIVAYIKWVGKDVKKGVKPKGSGITELPYLNRAASPENGKAVYVAKCQTCHGPNGEGVANANGIGYIYPPLWGEHSYNIGAGLFRLSRFAGYVRDNMPFKQASHSEPALTDEEAWDVAAYVNSQPRPYKDLSKDWPDISKKPIDHPFGPYSDGFSEQQHKFGPFKPIVEARKK
ncbi:c-type cytochrome [Terrimonas pollutisoli]|uniref:c-type cytochrome n=1 Tax=Terrimonas pollutisoli TaxID=3034147 RepID=UPI0023EA9D64|nr:c-type cytochrome [Terrimonas sp. H1YJ31]